MSTSDIWMTIAKSMVYQWYLGDYRDRLRSTSGFWMTIDKVRSTTDIWMTIILGHPEPKKMLIFRFVGIFEYIILLMLILFLDMCKNS